MPTRNGITSMGDHLPLWTDYSQGQSHFPHAAFAAAFDVFAAAFDVFAAAFVAFVAFAAVIAVGFAAFGAFAAVVAGVAQASVNPKTNQLIVTPIKL